MIFHRKANTVLVNFLLRIGRRSVSVNVFCISVNIRKRKGKKFNPDKIRTHNLWPGRRTPTRLRHDNISQKGGETLSRLLLTKNGLPSALEVPCAKKTAKKTV